MSVSRKHASFGTLLWAADESREQERPARQEVSRTQLVLKLLPQEKKDIVAFLRAL
jgi:hypothetical protein